MIHRKKSNIRKKDVMISLMLSGITMISNAFMGIFVAPAYLTSIAVMRNKEQGIILYPKTRRELFWTLCCIFLVGSILGGINLLLASQAYQTAISFRLSYLTDALRAGIFEEIFFRMFLYAVCMEVTGLHAYSKVQEVLCYLIMVLPHVFVHFSGTIDVVSVLILSVCFGLPFAIMQRKVNLLSAIGAHSMVDFIRFIVLGI